MRDRGRVLGFQGVGSEWVGVWTLLMMCSRDDLQSGLELGCRLSSLIEKGGRGVCEWKGLGCEGF